MVPARSLYPARGRYTRAVLWRSDHHGGIACSVEGFFGGGCIAAAYNCLQFGPYGNPARRLPLAAGRFPCRFRRRSGLW